MRKTICLLAAIALAIGANAQNPAQPQPATHTTVSFVMLNPPVPPSSVNINLVGVPGFSSVTIYYWLVSEFPIGNSNMSGPWAAFNAPNTLSSQNYEVLSFPAVAGASSYDILKTSSPLPPSGACNCAVAVGTSSTTVNDQTNSTSSYTINPFSAQGAILQLADEATGAPGAAHLILRQNGNIVADLSQGGGGGGGCQVNPSDGGCAITGTPSVDLFIGGIGPGTGWVAQFLAGSVTFTEPVNINGPAGQAGVYSFGCGTDPGIGSGVAIAGPICSGFTPYIVYMPSQAGSGFLNFSNTANKVTATFEPNINLAGDVGMTVLPVPNGGTGGSTQPQALSNILNSPTRNGDICCFYIGGAYTNLAGNNGGSGQTGFVTENGTGSPGFVIIPIPVGDGGTGLTSMTLDSFYKGQNASSMLASNLSENAGKTVLLYTGGIIQSSAAAFSTYAACSSGLEGSRIAVTDSTTNTWGATITGSGSDHVLGYCDGTNWTVAGK